MKVIIQEKNRDNEHMNGVVANQENYFYQKDFHNFL